jgi:glycosyltransferase involved in cell wall biosynthesis
MSSPLRVLMISDVPWKQELGAARVQIDFAAALRAMGHLVEKFDSSDAFRDVQPSRLRPAPRLRFVARARDFAREHGHRFDVIEALQGDLPFSKRDLGFDGLLVARSVGLFSLYDDYIQYERRTWPSRIPGTILGKTRNRLTVRRWSEFCRRSFEVADVIRVLNDDEEETVRSDLGLGGKCLNVPEGIADSYLDALSGAAARSDERLDSKTVVFIGYWSLRKGSADWGRIVARVHELLPRVRFHFLGTGVERAHVLSDLPGVEPALVSVVPRFEAHELPRYLASATVGALPSYVEGFGLGVLEQLAAGVPSVAYDVPGPRASLRRLSTPPLAKRGDTEHFARLLTQVLTLDRESFARLSEECIRVAGEFRSSSVAEKCVAGYHTALRERRAALDAPGACGDQPLAAQTSREAAR